MPKSLVIKFGGASVRSADAVRKIPELIRQYQQDQLFIVISAMGKTTNLLETITKDHFQHRDWTKKYDELRDYHLGVYQDLISIDQNPAIHPKFYLDQLLGFLEKDEIPTNYDLHYDRIVSFGELLSTSIIHQYLSSVGIQNSFIDARELIITDPLHRDARVLWEETEERVLDTINDVAHWPIITQGFIGSTSEGETTTLGREGSDFSASIIANLTNAQEMIVWKDVAGVFSADPHLFDDAIKLDRISYNEAIEMAYFGAKVLHPKTIKPLQNKNIPLYVKSFNQPLESGTLIHSRTTEDVSIPSIISKDEQVLVSFRPHDFSFVAERNIYKIFQAISQLNLKVNLMHNSAINFAVCMDYQADKIDVLIHQLQEEFRVKYNTSMKLITLRHFDQAHIEEFMENKKIYIEQRSRSAAQFVVKSSDL